MDMTEDRTAPITAAVHPINNAFYLRRRSKIIVLPVAAEAEDTANKPQPLQHVATALKNLEALGYIFSDELVAESLTLPLAQFLALYDELVAELKDLRGERHPFKPMYPNFPDQVMDMSEVHLYLNAIVHYWSNGKLFPVTEVKERPALLEPVQLTQIALGTIEEFTGLFGQIVAANTAMSDQDKEDATWFVEAYGDGIVTLLPDTLPNKENAAFLAGLLLKHVSRDRAVELVGTFTRTATDVLRLAVALSGGDISLAAPTKFRTFSRPERVLLLGLLNGIPYANATEDMLRWKGRWLRLGEKLHPGEYARRFPNTVRSFSVLRNDEPFTTFNSAIEKALVEKKVGEVLARLSNRPGELARRLDHLLRLEEASTAAVLSAFEEAALKVSTPVLLQVRQHFVARRDEEVGALRVFFPKGNLAKAQAVENTLPPLARDLCDRVVTACEAALIERFAALPSVGTVYVDPDLESFMVPFGLRSASRSLRTLVRGSRLPLPPDCAVLRFFVWWRNGKDRTDIDLSAALFNDRFEYMDVLSYYNLKGFAGLHSGDIVDAPEGASEFIDVTLDRLRKAGVRYVVMTLHSYTRQPFVELPECFAGWMARRKPGSGEIYEPRTVQDRLDLTADTKIALPLVIDVLENKVVWCDMALRRHPQWQNNVHGNLSGIAVTMQSLVEMKKPNLYDLFRLHAQARGTKVNSAPEADTVFSVESGLPFRLEEITSEYMI